MRPRVPPKELSFRVPGQTTLLFRRTSGILLKSNQTKDSARIFRFLRRSEKKESHVSTWALRRSTWWAYRMPITGDLRFVPLWRGLYESAQFCQEGRLWPNLESIPSSRSPSRLNPEMELQKIVVFLRERKQWAGHFFMLPAERDTNSQTPADVC
jgi:hypothetical protein